MVNIQIESVRLDGVRRYLDSDDKWLMDLTVTTFEDGEKKFNNLSIHINMVSPTIEDLIDAEIPVETPISEIGDNLFVLETYCDYIKYGYRTVKPRWIEYITINKDLPLAVHIISAIAKMVDAHGFYPYIHDALDYRINKLPEITR
jgi:hypothetical protein